VHLERSPVEREVGESENGLAAFRGRSPQVGTKASDQLLKREDEVVVGPRLEPGDTVGNGVARRQHQDRDTVPGCPDRAADVDAFTSRHEHVQDDGVEGAASIAPSACVPSDASSTS
jgi:hypothetical protein